MKSSSTHCDHTSPCEDRHGASVLPVSSTPLHGEVNSFIGRESLLNAATHLLGTARIVTLIGPGGVGKTRLLVRLAAELTRAGTYPHGVALVRLAELKKSDDRLESTVAEALGIPDNSVNPLDVLIEYFRHRRMLLMLDNCEHLVGQVPRLLNTLLTACPALRVMTTSRVQLAVPGEHKLVVPPLCVGDTTTGHATSPDGVHEAVRLLIDRAAAVGVEISVGDLLLATRLCQLLSGIPLAIELAAVQLDTMTLSEMVDHPDLLELLVDGPSEQRHHQTMRAALAWSHTLLTESEQRMWALVAVFEGSFDLEAAQAVCRDLGVDEGEVLSLLARLVRKSVLVFEARDGRSRYRMLEMIRQYGLELVAEAGLEGALRQAHADYFDALAELATREWFGPNEFFWRSRLRADLPNLRAAQRFFLSRPGMEGRALKLAINAGRTRFFFFAGLLNEALRMLEVGLDAQPDSPSIDKVAALTATSWITLLQGNHLVAAPLLAQAEAMARELGCAESPGLLYSRGVQLSLTRLDLSSARPAMTLLSQAKHAFRANGASGEAFMAELFLTIATIFLGDHDTAFRQANRLLAAAQAANAPWAISWATWATALTELQFGDLDRACELAHDGLRLQREIDDTWGRAWSVWAIALIAVSMGEYELAGQLFGGSSKGLRQTHTSVLGLLPLLHRQQQAEREARRKLGAEEFAHQVALGDQLSWSEVVELAFQLQPRRTAAPGEELPEGLSAREFEVAGLVAQAMSNREIGEQLGISPRTVEEHIRNINRKLGLTNRVEIAAWHLRLLDAS